MLPCVPVLYSEEGSISVASLSGTASNFTYRHLHGCGTENTLVPSLPWLRVHLQFVEIWVKLKAL